MVLGTAVAGLSCLADVTSANIVGYQSNTLVAGKYNMISLPFAGVATGTQKLSEALSGGNWYPNDDMNLADNILVYDPATADYKYYYYWIDESGATTADNGWYYSDGVTFFDDCEWNADGLEAGWSVWYRSRGKNAPNVTFSGAVESADDVQITIYGGCYNMIANPFPVAFQPNADQPWWEDKRFAKAVDWNHPHANDDMNLADNILVYDPATADYAYYYYWEDSSHEYDGWYASNGVDYFETDPLHPENADGLTAGRVFWYRSRDAKGSNRKITFINPTK